MVKCRNSSHVKVRIYPFQRKKSVPSLKFVAEIFYLIFFKNKNEHKLVKSDIESPLLLDRTGLEVLSDSHSLQAVDVATSLYLPLRQRACHLSQHELTHLFTSALRDFLNIESSPVRRAIGLASLVSLIEQSPALIVNVSMGARDGEFPSALEKKREEIQHREEARLWGRLECQFRKHQLILARHMCRVSPPEACQRDRRDCLLDYAFQSLGTGD
jgi:hypothetical protein